MDIMKIPKHIQELILGIVLAIFLYISCEFIQSSLFIKCYQNFIVGNNIIQQIAFLLIILFLSITFIGIYFNIFIPIFFNFYP